MDHQDLIALAGDAPRVRHPARGKKKAIADADLSGIFGIELESGATPARAPAKAKRGRGKNATTVTAKELVSSGVSRSSIQSWLNTGVLTRTKARGVYGKTEEAERRIAARRAAARARE